jgi:hypothetical protein
VRAQAAGTRKGGEGREMEQCSGFKVDGRAQLLASLELQMPLSLLWKQRVPALPLLLPLSVHH